MDTDSAYMALTGPLESIIKPERAKEFYEEYGKWFPRPYCDSHAKDFLRTKLSKDTDRVWVPLECCKEVYRYDLRTPGLFKEEFKGEGIVALNSKTYFCWGGEDGDVKYSSKGLSKRTNRLTKACYLDVLRSGKSKRGVNKGFVLKQNVMYTYEQFKTGLTYFYPKRKVLEDGVSTANIDA